MIVTEYMENGALDTYLKVVVSILLSFFHFPFITKYLFLEN